jgi:hypothetical protein
MHPFVSWFLSASSGWYGITVEGATRKDRTKTSNQSNFSSARMRSSFQIDYEACHFFTEYVPKFAFDEGICDLDNPKTVPSQNVLFSS